jgi:hypothetical protein
LNNQTLPQNVEISENTDWDMVSERRDSVLKSLQGIYVRLRLKEETKNSPNSSLLSTWNKESEKLDERRTKIKELFASQNYTSLEAELKALEGSFRMLLDLERHNYSEIYVGK